jgi:hypothetical protein
MSYATVEELTRVLRLRQPTEAQGTAMQRVLDTAAGEENREIGTAWASADLASWPDTPDTPDPLAAALLVEVNLERAVEHWQQQESPFGIVDLGAALGATTTSRDSWTRHALKLAPLKQMWGMA